MEHPTNGGFEINVDNIESAFETVVANLKTDEPVFVRFGNDLQKAIASKKKIFLLTDSISVSNFKARKRTAVYNSFIDDTKLKKITVFDSRNCKALFRLLKNLLLTHPKLRSLELAVRASSTVGRIFSEDCCAVFCKGLGHAKGLKELTLHDLGQLTDDKMIQMIASAIQYNKTLTSIKLVVESKCSQAIATSLKKNSRIQSLWIERPEFSQAPFDISFIKELFPDNTTIKTLSFNRIVFTDAAVEPLMSLLETTTSLQSLRFPIESYSADGNYVTYNQPQFNEKIYPRFIQSVMRPNSPLRTLKISGLPTQDINILFKALADNSTLTTLRLGKIEVDDDPNDPESWSFLYIDGSTIDAWNELLTKNKSLKSISLNGLVCRSDLAQFEEHSVDWFKHNKTLTTLDLRANNAVKIFLGEALAQSKTLKGLKCSRHFTPDPLWQELLANKTLARIDFSDWFSNRNDTYHFLQHNLTVQKLASTLGQLEGDLFLEELANNRSITSYTHKLTAYDGNLDYSGKAIAGLTKNWNLMHLDLRNDCYKPFYEPILIRNRNFQLSLTLVMHNIARQKPTIFPSEIWCLIFGYLTRDLSILIN